MDKITCLECKKVFEDYLSNNRVYCSKDCYSKAARKGEVRKCIICGNEFYTVPQRVKLGMGHYCSKKCQGLGGVWNKGLKDTQTANSGSFQKGKHKGIETEFKKGYDPSLHWNWKGGITPETMKIRSSVEYAEWRTKVFERDNYTCIWCHIRSGEGQKVILHADHIKPFAYFPELRLEVSNGRTLCKDCHKYTASYMGKAARYYIEPKKFVPIQDRVEYGGASLGPEEHDAIFQTILSQGSKRWTIGPESLAFEQELASVTGVKRAVVTNSGSSALLLAMTALHLPAGSKVIIPAVNFPTAFNAIIQCNLVPVVVDVDLKTLNISLEEVKKAIKLHPSIKAVVAVDIAGNPVDLIKLREIVGEKVKIILDDCDGYGTTIMDNNSEDWKAQFFIEQFADVSCVSFHAAHIITTGEGGAVLTDDEKLADRVIKLREWGRASATDNIYHYEGFPDDYKERYVYEEIGYNMKPLELQCAMGRIQLKKLQSFKDARRTNHYLLAKAFKDNSTFTIIENIPFSDPCWFSFAMLCNKPRGPIMEAFEKNNIECRTIFSGNITRHPAYKNTEMIKMGKLENADDVMKRGMFLSCHPSITQEMVDFIGKVAREV